MPVNQSNSQNVTSQDQFDNEYDPSIRDAFRLWHFDALSDDAAEAVIIAFWDNYVFSPRYLSQSDSGTDSNRFPAVSFLYYVNGKQVLRTINEFPERQLSIRNGCSECTIGGNRFFVDSIEYGSGYVVTIDLPLGPRRRLKGSFEWLKVEIDRSTTNESDESILSPWNILVPRSDVTGRIELVGANGRVERLVHFRGSGYHDRVFDSESLFETYRSKHWGRVHFADKTIVFSTDNLIGDFERYSRLIVIQDGVTSESEAECREVELRRDRFGIKYPSRLILRTADGSQLVVKAMRTLESNMFQVRGLAQMRSSAVGGANQTATGIFEYIKPRKVNSRIFRWLAGRPIMKVE